jgi:Holliday junction resolvase RusA-like endonuclease
MMTTMNNPLILPMMMYGKFRSQRVKKDEQGNTIYKINAKGEKIPVKEKVWIEHKEERGDPGVYPSVNHIYVNMTKGRKRLSKPAERLKEKWSALAKTWAKEHQWEMTQKEKVVVELTAHFPNDNINRDVNNAFKLLMDALEGIIYDNDAYALPRVMDTTKVKDGEKPFFEIHIYKKEDEDEVQQERLRQRSALLSTNK